MGYSHEVQSIFWGVLSAISLPIGALLGIYLKPSMKKCSAAMAYGAGALLFALTIELFSHVPHHVEGHGMTVLYIAIGGALAGGLLFDLLNQLLNNRGAFLRKFSVAKKFLVGKKSQELSQLIEQFGHIEVFRSLPPDVVGSWVHFVKQRDYLKGSVIFKQGDIADELYFVVRGEVKVLLHDKNSDSEIAILKTGTTFGEMGLLNNKPRMADAIAESDVRVLVLDKGDFHKVIKDHPEAERSLAQLATARLSDLSTKVLHSESKSWIQKSKKALGETHFSIKSSDVAEETKSMAGAGAGAAMAIWMGIFIDGIPESLVIGMLVKSPEGLSLAFVAGVFLANLPEAMSSSVTMKKSGMKTINIILMWLSIVILTGVGAWLGASIFPANPTGSLFYFTIFIESLAAGAMLTMIAETMLPEAFEHGGSIVGFATLSGFLSALVIKVL